jgi:hypothetical protein
MERGERLSFFLRTNERRKILRPGHNKPCVQRVMTHVQVLQIRPSPSSEAILQILGFQKQLPKIKYRITTMEQASCYEYRYEMFYYTIQYIKRLRGLSQRANCTDRASAACRRSWCSLCGQKVSRGERNESPRPYSHISRTEPRLSSKYLLSCTHETEWTPFQTHYFSKTLVVPETNSVSLDLWPGFLTTSPERW